MVEEEAKGTLQPLLNPLLLCTQPFQPFQPFRTFSTFVNLFILFNLFNLSQPFITFSIKIFTSITLQPLPGPLLLCARPAAAPHLRGLGTVEAAVRLRGEREAQASSRALGEALPAAHAEDQPAR